MYSGAAVRRQFTVNLAGLALALTKKDEVEISIYLNTMITCLRLRLRATLHGHAGPGIPLSIKMHVIDAVKETCQGNFTKYQDALSTCLCCLWKFRQDFRITPYINYGGIFIMTSILVRFLPHICINTSINIAYDW